MSGATSILLFADDASKVLIFEWKCVKYINNQNN